MSRRLAWVCGGRWPGRAVEASEATSLMQVSVAHSDAPDVAGAKSVDTNSRELRGLGLSSALDRLQFMQSLAFRPIMETGICVFAYV